MRQARLWLGTPFRHQAALRGVGCDCLGLIRGVAAELGICPPLNLGVIGSYARAPNPVHMGRHLAAHLRRVRRPRQGDIAWLEWREGLPMHLAYLAGEGEARTLIHAWETAGCVIEHGFVAEWPARVRAWWRLPALADGGN